jgi:uncharacterized protein YuzE
MANPGKETQKVSFFYNKTEDIFTVAKLSREKIKASIEVGDIIFDISHRGSLRGAEILNASKLIGVSKDILASANKAEIRTVQGRDFTYFQVLIWLDEKLIYNYGTHLALTRKVLSA